VKHYQKTKERSVVIVKPAGYENVGNVIDSLAKSGCITSRMRMCRLSSEQAAELYGDGKIADELSSGPIFAIEILGVGVQQGLAELVGDSKQQSTLAKNVFVSKSKRAADQEVSMLFEGSGVGGTATFNNCTLCIIKPHAVLAGLSGQIITSILTSGFDVSALELFNLDRQAAEEFLEVYKSVVPEYNAMVEHYTAGPSLAIEVRTPQESPNSNGINNTVAKFRELVGPSDPEIARHIRPNTLRAKFGQNKVKNAVHCTDLPEDGVLESEFFFSILQKSR